jgi:hypothetical protein
MALDGNDNETLNHTIRHRDSNYPALAQSTTRTAMGRDRRRSDGYAARRRDHTEALLANDARHYHQRQHTGNLAMACPNGHHERGWYLSDRLDRVLWRIDNPSVDRIVPELQNITVGDRIPDSVDGTAHFHVASIVPNRALVLHSRRHPVSGVWPDLSRDDPGTYLDFSWAFILIEHTAGTTRLLMRNRSVVMIGKQPAPGWVRVFLPLLDFFDFLYVRQMLRGIKQRVERQAAGIDIQGKETIATD